jgi:carbonic anhydrase
VKGHSNCGAVGAAIHSVTGGNIDSITQKIKPAIDKACLLDVQLALDNGKAFAEKVTHLNIENSIATILENSNYIREQKSKGDVGLVAAYYDTATGEVIFNELANTYETINN